MATGALDANGVWIYGEDDPASPVSDLLNLGMDSVSDAIGDTKARVTTLEGGAWTAYTATLGASGTAPNLGSSGGQAGYFTMTGKHVTGRAIIYWGTSPTVGTGFYVVTLPREAIATWGATNLRVGTVTLVRASGAEVHADLRLISTGQAAMIYSTGLTTAAGWAGSTAPWVPAAGDTYFVHFDYEAA